MRFMSTVFRGPERIRRSVSPFLAGEEGVGLLIKAFMQRFGQECLDQVATLVLKGVREGRPAPAFCEAIRKTGEALSEHFPMTPGDTNELPDSVITDEASH